jgi:hypothetical protein
MNIQADETSGFVHNLSSFQGGEKGVERGTGVVRFSGQVFTHTNEFTQKVISGARNRAGQPHTSASSTSYSYAYSTGPNVTIPASHDAHGHVPAHVPQESIRPDNPDAAGERPHRPLVICPHVNNNPLRYLDPSGHNSTPAQYGSEVEDCKLFFCQYKITLSGDWRGKYIELLSVINAAKAFGAKIAEYIGGTEASAFNTLYQGGINFSWVSSYSNSEGETFTAGAITKSATLIEIASMASLGIANPVMALLRGTNHMIHELGHAFASTSIGAGAYSALSDEMEINDLVRRDNPQEGYSYGYVSGLTYFVYQFSNGDADQNFEIFADMFVGWTTGTWFSGEFPIGWGVTMPDPRLHVQMANAKSTWINTYMSKTLRR